MVMNLLVFGFCDRSVREKYWRCRKRETQAMFARQGYLAGVICARQRQSFERMHML